MTGTIRIRRVDLTDCEADCIVNPANNRLRRGSGLCGEIYREAGAELLSNACAAIGWCETGEAVVTPAFHLNAKYIIHTVGPVWHGGFHHELQKLYCCYGKSLLLAQEKGCHSIVFPLLMTGVFNNPVAKTWKIALEACRNYLDEAGDYSMDICFAISDKETYDVGQKELGTSQMENFLFFSEEDEGSGYLTSSYPCYFVVEGVEYSSADQYIFAHKALMFRDLEAYRKIMDESDAHESRRTAEQIVYTDEERWNKCSEEIVYHAVSAKFKQNERLATRLKSTGQVILAELESKDLARSTAFDNGDHWNGMNLLGKVLMKVREELSRKEEHTN